MKRKYLALALAVLALSGCGSDNSRDTARVPTPGDGGGDINTGQPVDSIYYSHINENISDAEFTHIIKKFLAIAPDETVDDIDIGTVKAQTNSNKEGMQVRLNLGLRENEFVDWSNVDPSKMTLEIKIYDSYTYPTSQGGQGLAPLKTIFSAGLGRLEILPNDEIKVLFEDLSGLVWLKGTLNGNTFSGRMYFDNS
ncbi:MAG: hypothetical protein KDD37_04280, partial [Bdellovibrionales bacterium]|nr:hypothetical protein [Bdellovibrionales bacterium]